MAFFKKKASFKAGFSEKIMSHSIRRYLLYTTFENKSKKILKTGTYAL